MSDKMLTKNINFDFELKEDGDEKGVFRGLASPFGGKPDSHGDIIDPGAFSETIKKGGRNGNGIAMLWQHEMHKPIGVWEELKETRRGLQVTGRLAVNTQLGNDAYELMKMGALKGLSIGYEALDYEIDERRKIRHLKEIELWEISPVTFPAQTRANITNVKSAIESASNERELERALRDEANLSNEAAKYIVSLCKKSLFPRREDDESLKNILSELKDLNQSLTNKHD